MNGMDITSLAAGLAGLFLGGELLVRGAAGVAEKLGLPMFLIGLTVVGFGTSMPELLVSLDAALRGIPDIAIGNVVGSNISNILLILGLAALVRPIPLARAVPKRDAVVMAAAAQVLFLPFWQGQVDRAAGAVLCAALAAYLGLAYQSARAGAALVDGKPETATGLWRPLLAAAAGLALLLPGARLLVDGAVAVARGLDVPEAFIGLTVVAVGTSLPELAATLVAAYRRRPEIALGNIAGSNIFNVLGILGLTAVTVPIPVDRRFLVFDLPVMAAVSVLLMLILMCGQRLGRIAGLCLLAGFPVYVWRAQA